MEPSKVFNTVIDFVSSGDVPAEPINTATQNAATSDFLFLIIAFAALLVGLSAFAIISFRKKLVTCNSTKKIMFAKHVTNAKKQPLK